MWVRVAVAASLPADTISQFVSDTIRGDRANAHDIYTAWLKIVLKVLQPFRASANEQSHILSNAASALSSSSASNVDGVAPSDTARTISFDDLSNDQCSPKKHSKSSLGVDHSSGTASAATESAWSDVEYPIALLRSTTTAICKFSVKVDPSVRRKCLEHVTQLLSFIQSEAMRIRPTPNEDMRSRRIGVLLSLDSTLNYAKSTYVRLMFGSILLLILFV
jgi:hypothetical protein